MVQFRLLHSKYHLCSVATRALLLSTYIKFINLFPEIKNEIQEILLADTNLKNPDAELQQRACEYLQLSKVATADVLATVLEEMPPFPEKESSLLCKLKRKKPNIEETSGEKEHKSHPQAIINDSLDHALNTSGSGATADLLGLSTPRSPSDGVTEVANVFGSINGIQTNGHAVVAKMSDADAKKFVCKQNGILFENASVQIGVKMEVRQNLARIGLFYGNKTSAPLTGFTPDIRAPGPQLIVQAKPVDAIIEAGAQVQQLVNVECVSDFYVCPSFQLQYTCNGIPQTLPLLLPLFLNKFIEPTDMNSETFFARWKQLSLPTQECQKIFPAKFPIESEAIKTKLIGFGTQLLSNVDPNPENFVCAGIVYTKSLQIGCLIRLEPNKQAQVYRLTVRSSRDLAAKHLCELLFDLF